MKRLLIVLALLLTPAGAWASNCPGYPYVLTNGQTADANQVMSNFNSILNCANTNLLSSADLSAYAPLASPTFTGTPAAPTGTGGDSSTQIATDAFVANAVTGLLSSSTAAATYAPIASPTLTGTPAAPTASPGTSTTQIATTAFVAAAALKTPQAEFQYQQPSGTVSGETLTASTWVHRNLNTTVANTITGASLSSNQITLPAGTYVVEALGQFEPTSGQSQYKHRIRDVTASTTLAVSPVGEQYTGLTINGSSALFGTFTLSASHVIEMDTYSTFASTGGGALSTGEREIYVDVILLKIG